MLPDNDQFMYPCMIQENIDKLFEIRTTYIRGSFYSIAIFSQASEETSVDFRKYNVNQKTRDGVYVLPDSIKIKLKALVQKCGLSFCSIDLIYTPNGQFVFLEINPIGQFGMVSNYHNQQVEKQIAMYLAKSDKGIPEPLSFALK